MPATEPAPEPDQGRNVRQTVLIVLAVIVILAIAIAIGYGLITHPIFTSVLRDISIIVLALVTMVTCIFLAVLLFQLQSLIVLLRDEIQPILESVNETAGTVRGTTTFVSDSVVSPVIRASSYFAGVRATMKSLAGGGRRRNPPRSKPPQE